MKGMTPQTPLAVKRRLEEREPVFPADITLNQVAEESHRRYLAKRWKTMSEANSAVVDWGLRRLAGNKNFTADQWAWIVATDRYGQDGIYTRLTAILRPATGLTPNYRMNDGELAKQIKRLDALAAELLDAARGNYRLRISLRDMVGLNPEMQPLLNKSAELGFARITEIQQARTTAIEQGKPFEVPKSELSGYREPDLADFLHAFRAQLRGELKPASPSPSVYRWDDEGEGSDDAEVEDEGDAEVGIQLALDEIERLAVKPEPTLPLLDVGGSFGAYPGRKDALRRAVILAAPGALFDRYDPPPAATPASVIEECCISWFGESPTQKEINTAIRASRAELEAEMAESIESAQRGAEQQREWDAAGLTQDERRQAMFKSFLDLE